MSQASERSHTFDSDDIGEGRLFGLARRQAQSEAAAQHRKEMFENIAGKTSSEARSALAAEEIVWSPSALRPRRRSRFRVVGLAILVLLLVLGLLVYLLPGESPGTGSPVGNGSAPPPAAPQSSSVATQPPPPPAAAPPAAVTQPSPPQPSPADEAEMERLRQENQRLQNSLRTLNDRSAALPATPSATDQTPTDGDDPATLNQAMPVPLPRPSSP
jgi:hypothetical protein